MLPDIRALRRDVQCLIEMLARAVGPIDAKQGEAEPMQRVYVVRLFGKNALVVGNCFVMTPRGEAGVGMCGHRAEIVGDARGEWEFVFVHQSR